LRDFDGYFFTPRGDDVDDDNARGRELAVVASAAAAVVVAPD